MLFAYVCLFILLTNSSESVTIFKIICIDLQSDMNTAEPFFSSSVTIDHRLHFHLQVVSLLFSQEEI